MFFDAIFISSQHTIDYVGLLLVCMGWTVIRADLEKKKLVMLIIIGTLYFILELIYEFILLLRYTPATEYLYVPSGAETAFLVLTSIMDFVILFWIFWELFRSIVSLKLSKQEAKFQMFKILAITLLIAYIFSFTLFIIELIAQWNNYFNSWWRGWFFF